MPMHTLLAGAVTLRREQHGNRLSYSRKVFIPLTRLCRDVCGYCTFATTPGRVSSPYLSPDEVLAIARAGEREGCREALFTLGDRPEARYAEARAALAALGHASTLDYLVTMCALVLKETNLLPHVNAGLMSEEDMMALKRVSVSQGIMLESISERLCEKGGPHYGSPDKHPAARMAMVEAAGRAKIPFTSGILIGIGEMRVERVASMLALRDSHARHGHIQEIIVQNFRAKTRTRMAEAHEPGLDALLWTAAVARHVFGAGMSIQVPPNLSYEDFPRLIEAGIDDWGGISPVTADHVNPEAPWPAVPRLAAATAASGCTLVQRLAAYPAYALDSLTWQHPDLAQRVAHAVDSEGLARVDRWVTGVIMPLPPEGRGDAHDDALGPLIARASGGARLGEEEIVRLFSARGADVDLVCAAADDLRRRTVGDAVRYVVNRNINYTNVCTYHCKFCAFSKGKQHEDLRGRPYDLSLTEVSRRAAEAWDRGATEVCMQGGINPYYTGETYLDLLRAAKDGAPGIHVHAFSPLEVSHGASTLGLSIHAFLERLRDAGLGSLPGTAAEILDDEVRGIICPDKLVTAEWLAVMRAAHEVGLPTTSTIMFGHVERPLHWARHLQHIRDLQAQTGGFTEFVPLPFVHMEAPIYLRGQSRTGPTWREARLMHAVARLVLHPLITHIQASWVKLGPDGARAVLNGGADDLGGTLMNESISRAAGTQHGQEFPPTAMEELIAGIGRVPSQRTTHYLAAPEERRAHSFQARPLADLVQTPFIAQRHANA
ncbi:5-amino-6-(D-ribitylamino)uracil--L-tyrosine 4-hydroxyphenyl transferase CofH [Aquabacter sp. CN5-332]|uniref:5-amino-6-(D-ribitylamino)uracil--L-tyrosine 4-hydroxyphenyl transferase CofH n=1 Tax=Aquabacter sp. CN5-332 TaxID=3156608 RepID=UPI0032B5283B